MVAFTENGWREYQLFVNGGDSAVKAVSGLQEEIVRLTQDMVLALPTEEFSQEAFQTLKRFAREKVSNKPDLSISSIQNYVVGILRQYPVFKEILEHHLIDQIPESMSQAANLAYALETFINAEQSYSA